MDDFKLDSEDLGPADATERTGDYTRDRLLVLAVSFIAGAVVAAFLFFADSSDDSAGDLALGIPDGAAEMLDESGSADDGDDGGRSSFDVFADPRGSRVVLDGEELGTAPLRVANVSVGLHRLEVFGPDGYESYNKEISLGAGKREVFEVVLAPLADKGQAIVEFGSVPDGADVVVIADGQSTHLGPTPVTVPLKRSASYHAVFTKDGYSVVTRPVTLADKGRTKIFAALERREGGDTDEDNDGERQERQAKGDEEGARLTAATAAERSQDEQVERRRREEAERRRAEAEREQLRARRLRERAEAQARAKARARQRDREEEAALERLPPPRSPRVRARALPAEDTGTLMVGAKPPCQIVVDGRDTGLMTPQRAMKLSPGSHRIRLVNREHRIVIRFNVLIKAGATTRVIKDLTDQMR